MVKVIASIIVLFDAISNAQRKTLEGEFVLPECVSAAFHGWVAKRIMSSRSSKVAVLCILGDA